MTTPWSRVFKTVYTHRVVLKRILVLGFAVLVFTLLVVAVLKVDWAGVLVALKALPASALWLAAGLAFLSYCVYSCFDLLGRLYTEHHLVWWRSILVGFISYAFTMSLGSTIGGVGLRIRLYTKQGLRQGDVFRIWAISVLTNWTGYLLVLGVILATGQFNLPGTWGPGDRLLQFAGAVCLLLVAAYLIINASLRKRVWTIRGHTVELPGFHLALAQALLGALVWVLVATVPYILFQERVPYPEVLGIVQFSAVAGLVARVPGGLGVIEYVFVTMLSSSIPRNEILAVLLVFRLFYYIGPLLIAGLCYLVAEAGLKTVPRGST